jgi:hypothetical protein
VRLDLTKHNRNTVGLLIRPVCGMVVSKADVCLPTEDLSARNQHGRRVLICAELLTLKLGHDQLAWAMVGIATGGWLEHHAGGDDATGVGGRGQRHASRVVALDHAEGGNAGKEDAADIAISMTLNMLRRLADGDASKWVVARTKALLDGLRSKRGSRERVNKGWLKKCCLLELVTGTYGCGGGASKADAEDHILEGVVNSSGMPHRPSRI